MIFSGLPWADTVAEKATSIRLYDLKTNQRSTLPGSEGFWKPRWSPDGRYVIALTADSKKLMIYDLKSRQWSQLAALDDVSNLPGLETAVMYTSILTMWRSLLSIVWTLRNTR